LFQKFFDVLERFLGGSARSPNKSDAKQDNNNQAETAIRPPKQVIVFRFVVIAVLIGAIGMILANFLEVDSMIAKSVNTQQTIDYDSQMSPTDHSSSPFSSIENELEQRTKDILEKMIGVGKVSVLITVESTEEQIIEQNKSESKSVTQETDKNGGLREITTTTHDGQVVFLESSGEQEPVITKVINPRIRGVLIVAEGAEDATVRKLIIQAVEKGLNVHQSKISVVPSKI